MTIDELKIGGRNYVLNSDQNFTSEGIFTFDQADLDIQSLRGKTIAVSVDIELANGIETTGMQNRLGYEPNIHFADDTILWCGCWHYIAYEGANYKGRKVAYYTVPDKEIISVNQAAAIQIRGNVTKIGRPQFEIGNVVTDWRSAVEDIPTMCYKGDVENDNLPWNAQTGIYGSQYTAANGGYIHSSLILHFFGKVAGLSCPAVQLKFDYANGGVYYRSARDNFGFEMPWTKLAASADIPTSLPASDVYAWAKKSTKPSYVASEISGLPQNVLTTDRIFIQPSAPSNPSKGDIFIKTT